MNKHPHLTFTEEVLKRKAELRPQKDNGAGLQRHEIKNIIFFNGLLLLNSNINEIRITYVKNDHWLLDYTDLPVFLGLYNGFLVYANNIRLDKKEISDEKLENLLNKKIQMDHQIKQSYFASLRKDMLEISYDDAVLAGTGKALIHWNLNTKFCSKCSLPLELRNSGWEAYCKACESSSFPRTDPVVIILITNGSQTLLGRSYQFPNKLYSCLAGFIEPGETFSMAARREVQEEVGIDINNIKYITNQPWPFPSSLMIGLKAETDQLKLDIDKNELEDAVWLSKEELKDLLTGNSNQMVPARPGTIARYLLESWVQNNI
ncbi:MAG: NAD(+) diphosphatase [Paracoccaceae bacterium]